MATWRFTSDSCNIDYLASIDTDKIVVLDGDAVARTTFGRRRWPAHTDLVALSLRGQRPRLHRNPTRMLKSIVRYLIRVGLARRPRVRVITLASSSETVRAADNKVHDAVPIDCTPADIASFAADELSGVGTTSTFWFGVLGVINHRKNLPVIADALLDLADNSTVEPGLVLAGSVATECQDEVLSALARLTAAGIPTRLVDNLDDTRFDAAIGAVDVVIVAYSNDGPSGVLAKAARLGTRVVAAGSKTLRNDVERLELGAWGTLNRSGLCEAMIETARRPDPAPATQLGTAHFGPRLLGSEPLRILAWPAFKHRWANRYTAELADHLVAQGNEVKEFGLGRALFRRYDIVLLHWPEFAPTHRSRAVRFLAAPAVLAVLAAHRLVGRAKLIWTIHNVRPHDDPSPWLRRWFMTALTDRLDGVIALNHTGLEEAIASYPALANAETLVTRHPAYTLEPDAGPPSTRSPEIEDFLSAVNADDRLLVSWGKMSNYKQLDDLALTVSRLDERTRSLFAGRCDDPFLLDRLKASEKSNPDRVRVVTGHIADEDLVAVLERADAAVFNFSDITNSGSVIASLSAGVPVIAPSHRGLEELGKELGDGWVRLFDPPLDPDVLRQLLDEPPPTGTPIAERPEFRFENIAAETEGFFHRVTGTLSHSCPSGTMP